MKSLFFIIILMMLCFCAVKIQAAPDINEMRIILPSQSPDGLACIGPVKIGMGKDNINALGILKPHPQYSEMTIPINVIYKDDFACEIQLNLLYLEGPAVIDNVSIPEKSNIQSILKMLGDCKETRLLGGTEYECSDGQLLLQIGSANPDEIWVIVR